MKRLLAELASPDVVGRRAAAGTLSLLTLLSITGLDAPVVALVWQWCLADVFQAAISGPDRLALFLTAWLIYVVDRVADSFTIPPGAPISLRQQFCLQHRPELALLIVSLAVMDAFIALRSLERETLITGMIVGAAVTVYLGLNHFAGSTWRKLPIKELLVGFLFAVGTTATVHRFNFDFILGTFSFGLLCSLNCLSISAWECDIDLAQGRESFATVRPDLVWLLPVACWILAGFSLVMAGFSQSADASFSIALSAASLALLHRAGFLPRDSRVALADLVLLTPLLFLLIGSAR